MVQLERLKKLIDSSTREEIADKIGCDQSLVTKHYNGERKVTVDYVVKYAKHFQVSTDYLLGLTEYKSVSVSESSETARQFSDFSGLSEKAIAALRKIKTDNQPEGTQLINFLLENYSFHYLNEDRDDNTLYGEDLLTCLIEYLAIEYYGAGTETIPGYANTSFTKEEKKPFVKNFTYSKRDVMEQVLINRITEKAKEIKKEKFDRIFNRRNSHGNDHQA